jgi:septum site-determining protein MinC
MSQAPSVAFAAAGGEPRGAAPAGGPDREVVSLKGTTRGLEIMISGSPSLGVLRERLTELLAEAPRFFAGCAARVAFAAPLPSGALACLEEVATRFELTIVEIGPLATRRRHAGVVSTRRAEPRREAIADGTVAVAEDAGPRAAELGPANASMAALPATSSGRAADDSVAAGAPDQSAVPAAPLADVAGCDIALGYSAPYEAVTIEPACDDSPRAEVVEGTMAIAAQLAAATAAVGPATGAASHSAPEPAAVAASEAIPAHEAAMAGAVVAVDLAGSALVGAPVAAPVGAMDTSTATAMAVELVGAVAPGARLVVGPVRSGVIVDHPGHVIVLGDVNPGAEVRAEGSIIVLGRMRGVGHAAIGRVTGFIVALSLQPQQLRIGRMVARAADTDRPSDGAEIAYATGETIVVERFSGRLPSGLAASM